MAALTSATPRRYQIARAQQDYPVVAGTTYEGSVLADNGSGIAEAGVSGATFLGFANSTAINGGADGSVTINVITEGIVQLVVAGATSASTAATVYASDDATFTTTSTSNLAIGRIVKVISGTTCLVKFEADSYRSIEYS